MRAGLVVVLLICGAPSPGLADEIAARLHYERDAQAAQCPEEVVLRDAVAARLGYPVFDRAPATRAVDVEIQRVGGGLRARVEVRDEAGAVLGTREIDSPGTDCVELISAVALAISIALDPSRLLGPEPEPEPVAAAPPAASCPEPAACPACVARAPDAGGRVPAVSAGLSASTGLAPAVAPAVALGVELWWGRSFGLGAEVLIDLGATADATPSGRVHTQITLGLARMCFGGALSKQMNGAACALGGLGALRGRGEGVDRPQSQDGLVAVAGLRAQLDVRLIDHLQLRARLDGLATLTRITLALDGEPAWTSPPVAGLGGLDLVVDFP